VGDNSSSLIAGDLDNNGHIDLAVTDLKNNVISTLFNADHDPLTKVIYPDESGIKLARDNTYTIIWTGFTGDNIKIQLLKGERYFRRIDDSAPNNGAYSWVVPTSIDKTDNYRIKIISGSNPSQFDFSNNYFSIYNSAKVVYPSEPGLKFKYGDTVDIRWTSFNGSNVKIHLYKGNKYKERVTDSSITPNDGSFTWTVQNSLELGVDYHIKIISNSNSKQVDFSDYFFEIQ
jgi:hypothetical protein